MSKEDGDSTNRPSSKRLDLAGEHLPALQYITALLQLVGLPGVIVLAWMSTLLMGKYDPEHLYVWGIIVGVSAAFSFVRYLYTIQQQQRNLAKEHHAEYCEQVDQMHRIAELSVTQLKINKEIYAVISSRLSIQHVIVLLPIFMEAFKLKLIQTLIPACDELALKEKMSDLNPYMQMCQIYLDTMMMTLIKQHVFFNDSYVDQSFKKCIDDVFLYIQSSELRTMPKDVWPRLLMQKVNNISSEVYDELNKYLANEYKI